MKIRSLLAILIVAAFATTAHAQQPADDERISHTPPVGPPWVRNFAEARTQALTSGKPIFLYSTKTY